MIYSYLTDWDLPKCVCVSIFVLVALCGCGFKKTFIVTLGLLLLKYNRWYISTSWVYGETPWHLTVESENEDRELKELSDHEKSHLSLPDC